MQSCVCLCFVLIFALSTDQFMLYSFINTCRSCGIPGFENQPELYVWLSIVDVVVRTCSSPFLLNYRTTDTYAQHGADLLHRLTMENCLSHFSGVMWSRDIFKKPTQVELRRRHVTVVNALNPAQTGFSTSTLVDLTSMTLGSFQPRQGKITMNQIESSICNCLTNIVPAQLNLNKSWE